MKDSSLLYDEMVQDAMIGVVKRVLTVAAHDDLPGDHHFYVTFATRFPGVELPDRLLEEYDQEMTIVLQHDFWDISVDDDRFSVSLNFNSIPAHLVVPYRSIMNFFDPSVKFGLQFTVAVPDVAGRPAPKLETAQPEPEDEGGDVVNLDAFRKK